MSIATIKEPTPVRTLMECLARHSWGRMRVLYRIDELSNGNFVVIFRDGIQFEVEPQTAEWLHSNKGIEIKRLYDGV